ncbi:hypothetical protein B0J13DRAFT_621236 [Dactylonectria estremocensis]|uniref:BRCT domain-containing protein n=1 Tax=Dactylonectria estremocensis TaxID=1079267 RepID=A0A9P9F1K3_9HYPO|nr:hypothetical protein B0J13DRAFT_621236 [Dactylonectria estremocensis]
MTFNSPAHPSMQPPPSGQPQASKASKAALPRHGGGFDPWNSSSTGHQRPEHNPGTGWRKSRNRKLNGQFGAGASGGERVADSWGAGSDDWDHKHKTLIPKAVRERAQRSVRDMLVQPGKMRESLAKGSSSESLFKQSSNDDTQGRCGITADEALMEKRRQEDQDRQDRARTRAVFDGVVVYVNGSTFPLVSDHKLKHLLTENGGHMSLHLARRRVTHVIIGRPAGGAGAGGGGGLSGSKLEKEIKKMRGVGVKFVGVEWVLESLKAGKRLPEARFTNVVIAPKGQGSVYGLYPKQPPRELPSSLPGHLLRTEPGFPSTKPNLRSSASRRCEI